MTTTSFSVRIADSLAFGITVNEAGTTPPIELHVEGITEAGEESGDVVLDLTIDDLRSITTIASDALTEVAS